MLMKPVDSKHVLPEIGTHEFVCERLTQWRTKIVRNIEKRPNVDYHNHAVFNAQRTLWHDFCWVFAANKFATNKMFFTWFVDIS